MFFLLLSAGKLTKGVFKITEALLAICISFFLLILIGIGLGICLKIYQNKEEKKIMPHHHVCKPKTKKFININKKPA